MEIRYTLNHKLKVKPLDGQLRGLLSMIPEFIINLFNLDSGFYIFKFVICIFYIAYSVFNTDLMWSINKQSNNLELKAIGTIIFNNLTLIIY